jgi:hypothetical protein
VLEKCELERGRDGEMKRALAVERMLAAKILLDTIGACSR